MFLQSGCLLLLIAGFTSAGILPLDKERQTRGFGSSGTNVDVGVGVNVGHLVGTDTGVNINRHKGVGVGVGVGVNTGANNHGIFKRDVYHGGQSLVYANVETFVPATSVHVGAPYYQSTSYVHSPNYYHSNRGGAHVGVVGPGVHVGVGSGVNVGVNLAGVGVGVGVLGK